MNLTLLDIINLASSLASLILSIIAIWLSLYFYTKSKDTEKDVQLALEAIRAQSLSLERLTARWMDRFTRYVTSPQPVDAIQEKLLQIITFTAWSSVQLPAPDGDTKQKLTEYLVSSYLALYYYAGLSNIATQSHLPQLDQLDQQNGVKNIVDKSHVDFIYMESIINSIDAQLVQNSSHNNLYQEALQIKPYVKDSTMVYSERANAETATTG